MILYVVLGIALVAAIVWLLIYKWADVPLLSKVQADLIKEEGVIDSIKTLKGGAIEIGLKKDAIIDPRLQVGPVVMVSAYMTSYIHFRAGQALPEKGMMVRVESTNRLYRFRKRSLNWVRSWVQVDSIHSGVTVSPY